MGSHIDPNGRFQSDKYPTTPPDLVPLKVTDKKAQPYLWAFADDYRAIDADFADDLQGRLRAVGYEPLVWRRQTKLLGVKTNSTRKGCRSVATFRELGERGWHTFNQGCCGDTLHDGPHHNGCEGDDRLTWSDPTPPASKEEG